jgi:PQQ-like domain
LLDPATGAGQSAGSIAGSKPIAPVEPVVAGSTLLTVSDTPLVATELASGRALWTATRDAATQRPPTVAGDAVHWLSATTDAAGKTAGTLRALALTTGQLRWQASLANFGFIGGATVSGDTVYVGTPPSAYRLATGKRQWLATPGVQTLGGPEINADGRTLYVGAITTAWSSLSRFPSIGANGTRKKAAAAIWT